MSTRSSNNAAETLARELDERIEYLIASLMVLMGEPADLSEEEIHGLLQTLENSDRISKVKEHFYALTVGMLYFGAGRLSALYGVPQVVILDEVLVLKLRDLLNQRLDGLRTEAELLAVVSGADMVSELIETLTFTKSAVNQIRKAADFSAAFSGQEGVWQAGKPHFRKKRVLAVLDSKTTRLCRDRMDGQVRNWDEPFIDPLSGSTWMHPPFIGGQLSKDEVFHYCRSASVPSE